MMSHEVRLSSEAERCIEEQILWYEADEANGGAVLADRWMDLLEAALESLGQHPERHGFAPENGRWLPGVSIRQMRFKPWKTPSAWRILYGVDADAKQVTVFQIRHEKRPLLVDGADG
jgi:plasmid stabilization system protein ParE